MATWPEPRARPRTPVRLLRRQFVLPEGLGAENVSADYDKGVLRVRVAGVTKPPEEPKKISVTDRSNNVVVQDN